MLKLTLYPTLFFAAIFLAMVQNFAHFVRNASDVNEPSIVQPTKTTGIVVPTGSGGRIEAGMALMIQTNADRMLITGTGQGVNKSDITGIIRADKDLDRDIITKAMSCCVDLDPAASNTIGNAVETGLWADQNNLERLILVTSDFHMPRAMALFQKTIPSRLIIAHPVRTPWLQTDQMGASRWWASPRRIQVIGREMIKYYAHLFSG